MYINNFLCCLENKDESKCGKIFRPWDNTSEKSNFAQDNTVSTTTNDDLDIEIKAEEDDKLFREKIAKPVSNKPEIVNKEKTSHEVKQSFRPVNKSMNGKLLFSRSKYTKNHLEDMQKSIYPVSACMDNTILPPPPVDYMSEVYNPMFPEVIQTNLAQSLGLPSNDPLLLESLAQGYALEEYARVLNQDHQAKVLASKKQRPKKYKCPHCDVGFSNNGQLKGHIRIHTGERPFKCEEKDCGKTFTRNEELTRHKRIHSGLRPFPCSHCGKRFGRKDHLKKHSRTHFQPRGVYAVPVMLPFEAWASGTVNGYPFIPMY